MAVILDESTHDIECFRDSEGIIKVKCEFDLQGNSFAFQFFKENEVIEMIKTCK